MNFDLTQDQRAMVNSVRQLVQKKFRPSMPRWQNGAFPFENIKDLVEKRAFDFFPDDGFPSFGLM
jgi:alkylation response protein AidB-like acyl-CoA dehydrogenase